MSSTRNSLAAFALLAAAAASPTLAQLRVAAWNVTSYSGGRFPEFQTSIYGEFEGRSMSPDVILGSEFQSQAGVNAFVTLLNTATGSPGDWAAAPFIDGPDSDSACFYRTTRIQLINTVIAAPADPGTTGQPRNTMRYDLRPAGYAGAAATIACYDVHLKAGSASSDGQRRQIETQRIRADAAALPAGWNFLVGGDFNIRSSNEAGYQALVGGAAAGRFVDPIATPGSWYNNAAFRFVHSQAPGAGGGGMDDRHDQILLSAGLTDGDAFDYVGNPGVPYSTTTWNDPNHSYRVWGNDGTSFNLELTVAGNAMVGPAIAQALKLTAPGAGHLPIVLDLRVPPVAGADAVIDFGQVAVGDPAQQTLTVANTADLAQWTASGIAQLRYSLAASAGFSAPAGPFTDDAGTAPETHTISMDTSAPGLYSGTVTVTTNSPETPMLTVAVTGQVVENAGCPADLNGDGFVDFSDYLDFLNLYDAQDPRVDFNRDGFVDFSDYLDFLNLYDTGC